MAKGKIAEIYDTKGNLSFPVTSAKATYLEDGVTTVQNKLDSIDSSMDSKANLNSIFSMSNMGQDVKEAMTGGSVAVVGKDAVLEENIVNGQVTAIKLDDELRKSTMTISNKIKNYKLLNTDDWTKTYCSLSCSDNELNILGLGNNTGGYSDYTVYYNTKLTNIVGHKLYIMYNYNVTSALANRLRLRLRSGSDISTLLNILDTTSITFNQYNKISKIIEIPATYTGELMYGMTLNFPDKLSATDALTKLKRPVIIDLTEIYGYGNEPSLSEIDEILNNYPNYFSSINLFNAKEIKLKLDESYSKVNSLSEELYYPAYNILSSQNNDNFGLTSKVLTGDGASSRISTYTSYSTVVPGTDKKYYFKCNLMVNSDDCDYIQISISGNNGTSNTNTYKLYKPQKNVEYNISILDSLLNHKGTTTSFSISAFYKDNATQSGKTLTYKQGVAIDVSGTFGKGNEPGKKVIDNIVSSFDNSHFYNTVNIFNSSMLKNLKTEVTSNFGEYVKTNELGNVSISSVPNPSWDKWLLNQYNYGMSKHDQVPVYNYVHGALESDAMLSVRAKYSRWSQNCVYSSEGWHTYGGHVFEGWNNIDTYRVTTMIGKNDREDEACLIVFSPNGCYANPQGTLTQEQIDKRIAQDSDDMFSAGSCFGRVRIGSDVSDEGVVFRRKYMESYARVVLKNTYKPTSSTSEGKKGQIAYDSNYIYMCIDDNVWKRSPLEAW